MTHFPRTETFRRIYDENVDGSGPAFSAGLISLAANILSMAVSKSEIPFETSEGLEMLRLNSVIKNDLNTLRNYIEAAKNSLLP